MLRKFTGALKRVFESSVGKMGCIDTVSGEEVLCLITLLDLFEGNSFDSRLVYYIPGKCLIMFNFKD